MKQTIHTLRAQSSSIYRFLLVLLLAYGSGALALCSPCAAPQFMACKAGTDASLRSDCCCGAAVCGEPEQQPPSNPAVEIYPKFLSALPAVRNDSAVAAHSLPPLAAPTADPVPPPVSNSTARFSFELAAIRIGLLYRVGALGLNI